MTAASAPSPGPRLNPRPTGEASATFAPSGDGARRSDGLNPRPTGEASATGSEEQDSFQDHWAVSIPVQLGKRLRLGGASCGPVGALFVSIPVQLGKRLRLGPNMLPRVINRKSQSPSNWGSVCDRGRGGAPPRLRRRSQSPSNWGSVCDYLQTTLRLHSRSWSLNPRPTGEASATDVRSGAYAHCLFGLNPRPTGEASATHGGRSRPPQRGGGSQSPSNWGSVCDLVVVMFAGCFAFWVSIPVQLGKRLRPTSPWTWPPSGGASLNPRPTGEASATSSDRRPPRSNRRCLNPRPTGEASATTGPVAPHRSSSRRSQSPSNWGSVCDHERRDPLQRERPWVSIPVQLGKRLRRE